MPKVQMERLTVGDIDENCYLAVNSETNELLVIDPGAEAERIFAAIGERKPRAVLLTHGHFDHIAGCAELQAAGAQIGCAEAEKSLLTSPANLAAEMGVRIPAFSVDFTFQDGDELDLCGLKFTVLATPGHTPGGVCFLCGDSLFTGDTLFCESVGRTDFPGGSTSQLRESVKKLLALPGNLTVYPGHDEPTTLEHERMFNPFV